VGCPTVDEMLAVCEEHFAALEAQQPCPENRATLLALRDARAWQQCRRAMCVGAGGDGTEAVYPVGLGYEEI